MLPFDIVSIKKVVHMLPSQWLIELEEVESPRKYIGALIISYENSNIMVSWKTGLKDLVDYNIKPPLDDPTYLSTLELFNHLADIMEKLKPHILKKMGA